MKYRLEEVPGVDEDLIGHYAAIIRGGQPAAAERMVDTYERVTEGLCDWPLSGREFETAAQDLQGIRFRGLISPFEGFQVFYLLGEDHIRVLAVIHATVGEEQRLRMIGNRAKTD